jgi:hypothetical protein
MQKNKKMSSSLSLGFELLSILQILIQKNLAGEEISRHTLESWGSQIDTLLSNKNTVPLPKFSDFPNISVPPQKTSTQKISSTKYLSRNNFEQIISDGKCICSYVYSKGAHQGLYCGTTVKSSNSSFDVYQQKCSQHQLKSKTAVGNVSSFEKIPDSMPAPFSTISQKNESQFVVNNDPHTLESVTDVNSFLFSDKLSISKEETFKKEVDVSSFDVTKDCFSRRCGKHVLLFSRESDKEYSSLVFENLESGFVCLGKIQNIKIKNNDEELPSDFLNRVFDVLSSEEKNFIKTHKIIFASKIVEDEEEEEEEDL